MASTDYRSALIVGAGQGLSASLARLLGKEGLTLALAARETGKLAPLCQETGARAYRCDVQDEAQVERLFADVDRDQGAPDVVVYNASARARGPFVDLVPAEVQRTLQVSAFGAFLVAQHAARRMLRAGHGAMLFTGASASVKGYAESAPLSRRRTFTCCANRAARGRATSSCGRGWSAFDRGRRPSYRCDPARPAMLAMDDHGGIPARLPLFLSRRTDNNRPIQMTRTTGFIATILVLVIGTLSFSPCSLSATTGAPRLKDAGLRFEDTVSPDAFAPDLERAFRQFRARRPPSAQVLAAFGPAQVNLIFHVLSGQAMEGNVTESVLLAQVSVLNEAYRSTGLHFNVAEIRRYPDSVYFAGGCFPTTEQGLRMKAELAVNPARFVNIYTCKLQLPYIAGYGTLPNEFPENDYRHGVVVDYATLPGSAAPLDMGHTLVHELGHYLGLLHTFQGGCAEPGDDVADTPAEASAAFGCQIGRDTCAEAGTDPINNFMDYSDDSCTNNFTTLQGERMQASIATFRPGLIATAFSIGPGMTGNWFDPAQSGHGFSIEVLPGDRMLADWYAYAPDGGPVWIFATGTITGNAATLQGFQKIGAGGRFPPNFDPSQLQNLLWGTLIFTFTDCNHGQVSWQPVVAGYTPGSMPLTRLTMPAGLSCP